MARAGGFFRGGAAAIVSYGSKGWRYGSRAVERIATARIYMWDPPIKKCQVH
uniref:Uncharacterized protein n=1 Tax=Oryza punctata TaxID=4537 RepID=A0A0E0KVD5_ORYPU